MIEIILGIVIFLTVVISIISGYFLYKFRSDFLKCNKNQSKFCYTIFCPCDSKKTKCGGYASRKEKKGYYCSNNPNKLIQNV